MSHRLSLLLLVQALLLSSAYAHKGCAGGEIMRRNPGGRLVERDTTWQQEAQLGAAESCTAYSYAPWVPIASTYPSIWNTASILPNDTEAQTLFASINATVNQKLPNISPRGTHTGDWTGVNTTGLSAPGVCWWTMGGCTQPDSALGLKDDITTVPEPNTWGYGFDDGPNCSHNAFYDYLQSQNQKASMFYIGSNVADWPLQAIRGVEDGHHICVHTWSHQYMTSFTNEQAFAELYYTRRIIKELLGVTPLCWRPPFGDVDNRIRMIAEGLNLTNIVWSDDTADWRQGAVTGASTPAQIDANYMGVINAAKNGSYTTHGPVVLTHELTNFTMDEAVKFLPQIKSAFKYVVPIATAYNWTTPYAESNITYPNFADYVAGQINASNSQHPSQLSGNGTKPNASLASSSSASGATTSTAASAAASSVVAAKASGAGNSASSWFAANGAVPIVVLLGLMSLLFI